MLFCNSETEVHQSINQHDCEGEVRGEKGSSLDRGARADYFVWLLVSCSRSLFSGIVTRCANTGFLRITIPRIPAFVDAYVRACVRAYVSIMSVSPAWTTSIGPDRFSYPRLYISSALCTRLKPLRCPTSTRRNCLLQSNFAKSACTSH